LPRTWIRIPPGTEVKVIVKAADDRARISDNGSGLAALVALARAVHFRTLSLSARFLFVADVAKKAKAICAHARNCG